MDLKCRYCFKKIGFISLRTGGNCPVNMKLIDVDDAPHGTELVMKEGFKILVDKTQVQPNFRGRVNHWTTCTGKKK